MLHKFHYLLIPLQKRVSPTIPYPWMRGVRELRGCATRRQLGRPILHSPLIGRATATLQHERSTFLGEFTCDLMPFCFLIYIFASGRLRPFGSHCPRASILRYAIEIYYYDDTTLICYLVFQPPPLSLGQKPTGSNSRASRRLIGYWVFLRRRYTSIDKSRFSLSCGMQ